MDAFFFWIFSLGMLLSGLNVILNRNPVACALSLVLSLIFMAALFVLLQAFFLAALQVLVYAGAVMVLFLFIIMLLDIRAEEKRSWKIVPTCLSVAIILFLIREFFKVLDQIPQGTALSRLLPAGTTDDIIVIGKLLFTTYLLPFEVTSLLLLVATIGVVLITKREVK